MPLDFHSIFQVKISIVIIILNGKLLSVFRLSAWHVFTYLIITRTQQDSYYDYSRVVGEEAGA